MRIFAFQKLIYEDFTDTLLPALILRFLQYFVLCIRM